MSNIIIIGAGLTGLSAAYHLEKLGYTDYELYEQENRPGGLLRSYKQDGFTFDFTGHLLHIKSDYFREFITSIIGLENLLLVSRNAAIQSHGQLLSYPFQMNLAKLPNNIIADCIKDFITRPSIKNPKNFIEWVYHYFGKSIGEHFFFPYNQKLLAYEIEKIHHSWTSRFVPKVSLDDIIQGALGERDQTNIGYNSQFYYPKTDGIEFVIKKLKEQIKGPINTEHKIISIDYKQKKVFFANGNTRTFSHLITTAPLDNLLKILNEQTNHYFSQAQSKLLCNSVININLGFNKHIDKQRNWIYFPEKNYPFYRIGFWHTINTQSVPEGTQAIYAEQSYLASNTAINKNLLEEQTTDEILKYLNVQEQDIITKKILHIPRAYVIYDTWREYHLASLLEELEEQSIYSVGRFGAWKYSSMEEAVLDGKAIAEKLHLMFAASYNNNNTNNNRSTCTI